MEDGLLMRGFRSMVSRTCAWVWLFPVVLLLLFSVDGVRGLTMVGPKIFPFPFSLVFLNLKG